MRTYKLAVYPAELVLFADIEVEDGDDGRYDVLISVADLGNGRLV